MWCVIQGWLTFDGQLDFFVMCNLPAISVGTVPCPAAHFADGSFDVCLAQGGSRLDGISLMVGLDDGTRRVSLPVNRNAHALPVF
jgi:hypothetical protein